MIFHALLVSGLLGSAAVGCPPGDLSPIDGSCKSYFECDSSGAETVKDCGSMKSFDALTLTCIWTWNAACVDKHKECEDGKTYAHPNCRLYYTCAGGRLQLQMCPLLDKFDPDIGTCSFTAKCNQVDCAGTQRRGAINDCSSYEECENGAWSKKSCSILSRYDVKKQECSIGTCNQCTEGDLAKGSACNSYHICVRGAWEEQTCPTLKRFDPDKKTCVWLYEYTCPDDVTPTPTTPRSSTSQTFPTLPPTGNTTAEPECKEGERKPNVRNCRKYYACKDGAFVDEECTHLTQFDSVDLTCVYWKARCAGHH